MFKYTLDFTNLIHISKFTVNELKKKITYYFDGRIETQTFADDSEFEEAVDAIVETGFLLIGETYYNKDRLSIVVPNGLDCTFMFIGNVMITHTYADVSEVEDVIAEIEPQFIEINGKWYQGKQIHVAKTNDLALTISYDYLGMDWFDVTYEDQAAYDEAIEKLANIGEGGGGSGTKKVKTPVLSPRGGEVDVGTTVTITCATEGATIYYTTDGSTPTTSSSTYSSPISITGTMTIKAFATKADMKDSSIVSGDYTVATQRVAAPTFSPSAGAVEIGTTITLASATDDAEIHYTTDNSTPDSSSPVYSTPIEITAATTIKAIAIKEGWDDSNVSSAAYTIVKVAAPTFSPSASEIESGTEITISSSTTGATIYYTDDGSTPTTSSTEYTGPITFTATKTYKAIAVKANCTDSDVTTKAYTLKVTLYAYAGVYNNPEEPEEPEDFRPTNADVTSEWLNNLVNLNKFVATQKEYGGPGDEKTFSGISTTTGGRVVYAIPASLGNISYYIQNGSQQAITNSFTKLTNTVDGIEYNCYVLSDWIASAALNYAFI